MKKRLLATLLVFVLSTTIILPVSAASPSDSLKGISYYGNLSNCKMTAQYPCSACNDSVSVFVKMWSERE